MKKLIFLRVVCISLFVQCSQKESFVKVNNGVQIAIDSINVKVQFYKADIVRVQKWTKSSSDIKKSLVVMV